jgi:hypothetical protein
MIGMDEKDSSKTAPPQILLVRVTIEQRSLLTAPFYNRSKNEVGRLQHRIASAAVNGQIAGALNATIA